MGPRPYFSGPLRSEKLSAACSTVPRQTTINFAIDSGVNSSPSLMERFRFAFCWDRVGDLVCASCKLPTTVRDNVIWYTWLGDAFLGISVFIPDHPFGTVG